MSHIYIFSPSSAVRDKAAFKRGIKRLEAMGHEVQIDPDALSSHMRFAGDDEIRLKAIGRAAASGANIAMISRGGYGLTRLLTHLPYKAIAKSIDNGTQYVGLSDFTAFQLAVFAKTQRITWQGPALGEDFGPENEPDDIMQACFDDLCLEQGEGTGWRMPVGSLQKNVKVNNAVLWGGNLAVLTSLLGTPFFPSIKKGVLFLEDVGEHPYKIERMLTQLFNAGVLQNQKAVVFGQFTSFKLAPHDKGFKLQTVIDRLRSLLTIPVLTGLPFGHVTTKVLLPIGAKIDLATVGRDAFLVWGHI
jgi:muramoyltetrapeptide carboxypeptidase